MKTTLIPHQEVLVEIQPVPLCLNLRKIFRRRRKNSEKNYFVDDAAVERRAIINSVEDGMVNFLGVPMCPGSKTALKLAVGVAVSLHLGAILGLLYCYLF